MYVIIVVDKGNACVLVGNHEDCANVVALNRGLDSVAVDSYLWEVGKVSDLVCEGLGISN